MSITHSPRNHRDKGSLFLSDTHAINAIEAAAFAEKIGRPFNHAITIHMGRGGVTRRAQDVIGHYLRMASQWLISKGEAPAYLWSLEHATDDTDRDKGLHVHALVSVPRHLGDEFRKLARNRWAQLAGINPVAGAVDIRPVGGKGQSYYEPECGDNPVRRSFYRSAIKGAVKYLLKSIDPEASTAILGGASAAKAMRINPARNRMIYGRRLSVSQNIGATARLRWAQERASTI